MRFKLPLSEKEVRGLKAGDVIYLTGKIFLARDAAHEKLLSLSDEKIPFKPSEMAMFHCGPVVKKTEEGWKVVAAGPTTSTRMELFEYEFIKRFGVRVIIGKGGMGERTQKALQEFGGVYAAYTGGAGALAAKAIKKVLAVHWLEELGMPEAVWIFDVESFGPLIVAMDSHGNSLYRNVQKETEKMKKEVLERI